MLQNAYFLVKIGTDTAENEQHFAEILPIGRRVAAPCRALAGVRERALPAVLHDGGFPALAKFAFFPKILQIFGGLVLG